MWVKDNSIADLTSVRVTPQKTTHNLPTLSAGLYEGIFVGAALDEGGEQWITFSTSKGGHAEQNSMDLSKFAPGSKVLILIESVGGAGLLLRGDRFKLVDKDRAVEYTKWVDLDTIYAYIKANQIKLAGPRVVSVQLISESTT